MRDVAVAQAVQIEHIRKPGRLTGRIEGVVYLPGRHAPPALGDPYRWMIAWRKARPHLVQPVLHGRHHPVHLWHGKYRAPFRRRTTRRFSVADEQRPYPAELPRRRTAAQVR